MDLNLRGAFQHIKFIKKKPMVLPRIAKGFLNKLILRRNVLRSVDLAVTYNCHYQCKYCSAALLKKDNKEVLTVEQIGDMWKEAYKLGAVHVNLTGGESLMRDEEPLKNIYQRMNATPSIKKYNKLCKQGFDKEYYENVCKPAEEISNPPLKIYPKI